MDANWWQTAVFYEVPVYAFQDSNADGVGDFAGLTERLDYLEWLGVDCLWLTPFYSSPLRDGGYDVSDYESVNPRYGTIEEVRGFVDGLHARGMRVIADLPINHTSDAHPWFQAARQSGSPGDSRPDPGRICPNYSKSLKELTKIGPITPNTPN